jgi:choline dehydrogenase-like flavoprotein
MWREMNKTLADMTEAFCNDTGVRFRRPVAAVLRNAMRSAAMPGAGSNHESGGARMGPDPSSSVLDPFNRVWEAPNVLVCDAACFPSLPPKNPTETSMALAVRASRNLLATA